ARLEAAYEKNLLSTRLDGKGFKTNSAGQFNETAHFPEYYQSYSEFLAEQFRRWSTTDRVALTALQRWYKDAGKTLDKFHKMYLDAVGEQAAKDMLYPSWEFTSLMEYLQASKEGEVDDIEFLRLRMALPAEPQTGIGVEAALTATRLALDEFAATIPDRTNIELIASIN